MAYDQRVKCLHAVPRVSTDFRLIPTATTVDASTDNRARPGHHSGQFDFPGVPNSIPSPTCSTCTKKSHASSASWSKRLPCPTKNAVLLRNGRRRTAVEARTVGRSFLLLPPRNLSSGTRSSSCDDDDGDKDDDDQSNPSSESSEAALPAPCSAAAIVARGRLAEELSTPGSLSPCAAKFVAAVVDSGADPGTTLPRGGARGGGSRPTGESRLWGWIWLWFRTPQRSQPFSSLRKVAAVSQSSKHRYRRCYHR